MALPVSPQLSSLETHLAQINNCAAGRHERCRRMGSLCFDGRGQPAGWKRSCVKMGKPDPVWLNTHTSAPPLLGRYLPPTATPLLSRPLSTIATITTNISAKEKRRCLY